MKSWKSVGWLVAAVSCVSLAALRHDVKPAVPKVPMAPTPSPREVPEPTRESPLGSVLPLGRVLHGGGIMPHWEELWIGTDGKAWAVWGSPLQDVAFLRPRLAKPALLHLEDLLSAEKPFTLDHKTYPDVSMQDGPYREFELNLDGHHTVIEDRSLNLSVNVPRLAQIDRDITTYVSPLSDEEKAEARTVPVDQKIYAMLGHQPFTVPLKIYEIPSPLPNGP